MFFSINEPETTYPSLIMLRMLLAIAIKSETELL